MRMVEVSHEWLMNLDENEKPVVVLFNIHKFTPETAGKLVKVTGTSIVLRSPYGTENIYQIPQYSDRVAVMVPGIFSKEIV